MLSALHRMCGNCMRSMSWRILTETSVSNGFPFRKMTPTLTSVRWRKIWLNQYYRDLYKRRLEAGPEPERHRSVWSNWDYNAEIYAFGERLGEQFNQKSIRQAFTHRSYIDGEMAKRAALGLDSDDLVLAMDHNEQFATAGREFASAYIQSFLRVCYPHFPETGINHVRDHLLCEDVTSFVACHCGMKDLILSSDFPPEMGTLSKTLFAVVGALLQDQGNDKAAAFVADLIITQLIGKDINELWPITDPMGQLADLLSAQGRPEPEARLTRHTGDETVMSVYFVGVYCNKQLIGEGPGETIPIAEEMAARDALKRLFGTQDWRRPLLLGKSRPELTKNLRLCDSQESQNH